MKKIKLFCLPYAGASAAVFSNWKNDIDPSIELFPVEMAGRGRKMHEPLYTSIEDAIENIFNAIKDEIITGPYAFFGHSMGALLSYEIIQKIKLLGLNEPEHIFYSGRSAPNVKEKEEKNYHLLNEHDFKAEVLELGGTPPHFFEHPELLDLFLPVLKNDFKLCAVDFTARPINPTHCNISVLIGKEEEITAAETDAWKDHTNGVCSLYYFNGGHFFLNDHRDQIIRLINMTLAGRLFRR